MAAYNVISTLEHILVLLLLAFGFVSTQISDTRLCADKECKVVISKARALGRHTGDHPQLLSFQIGDVVTVTSKSAGKHPHLWGGEVNGQKGYFDKSYVQEMKVMIENPLHEVATEGDVFGSLGKPPPSNADNHPRRQLVQTIKHESVKENEVKEEKVVVVPKRESHEDEQAGEGVKPKHADDAGNDDDVDDLLKKDDMLNNPLKVDETDLDDTRGSKHDIKESVDDDDDDEEKEKKNEDLEDDLWNIDPEEDNNYDWERDRFDTADLNQYLKKKLFSNGASEADSSSLGPSSESDGDSLKVESEDPEKAKDEKNEKHRDVVQPNQSNKNEDIHRVNVKDIEAPSEVPGKDHNNLRKNGEEDRESKQKETDGDRKHQSNEQALVKNMHGDEEEDDYDPTEINEFSPDEFDEEKTSTVKNIDSETKAENNKSKSNMILEEAVYVQSEKKLTDDEHSNDAEDVDKTNKHGQEQKTLSQKDTKDDSELETTRSRDSKEASEKNQTESKEEKTDSVKEKSSTDKEKTAENNENKSVDEDSNQEKHNEKISTDKVKLQDSEETQQKIDAESKGKQIIDGGKETVGKSVVTKNKEEDSKVPPGDEDAASVKNGTKKHSGKVESEIRPDTPSDTLSSESGQEKDPVAPEKSDAELSAASVPHKKAEEGNKNESVESTKSENVTNADSDEQPSDKSVNQSDEKLEKSRGQIKLNDSEVDHKSSIDEKKPDGFASFLQSSRTEPKEVDLATETPKLNTKSTTAFIEDGVSDSTASKLVIESSKTSDHRLDATKENGEKKVREAEGEETIVEGGSTIVLDKKGNLVTAIEDQISKGSNEMQPSSVHDSMNAFPKNSQLVNPTAVDDIPKPSKFPDKLNEELRTNDTDNYGNDVNLNKTQTGSNDSPLDSHVASEAYQSSDFNSRNLLSVNQPPATSQRQQQPPPTLQQQQQQPSGDVKQQEQVSVEPTPTLSLPFTVNSEMRSEVPDVLAESADPSQKAADTKANNDDATEEQIKDTLHDHDEESDNKSESTTHAPVDNLDILPPPSTLESQSASEDTGVPSEDISTPPEEYATDSVYHSRKITDENLTNEEEQKFVESSLGFFKRIFANLNILARDSFEKLPPSLQSTLEPFHVLPNMKVLIVTFALALLISTSFISCCFSGGSNKKQQRDMFLKLDEIEKRRLIDFKEIQNLEDEIASKVTKNVQMKEEIVRLTEEAKKNKSELHTLQLHNETIKKQLDSQQGQIKELKENANSKQGEVKQQSKKTKDLEKHIKKLEERERNLEQRAQKVTSDLKHKEEEVMLLTSKVIGLTDQVGHLQTSKDQLLAEAEDWREKVSDMKERLEQREEEFKQMQETIMFKENELEELKDCFLQLKSFEENEEEGENAEDTSVRVQDKIASMMDVSKMNASLRALEEERDSLGNKLYIEMEARRELEEQLESSRRSVESSMADKMKAERQCQEAQTKLSVLSSYFKEKELQLQRELGEQEALKKQNQTRLVSADETTKSVQQEIDFVRTQSESLKRELASSERDFRSQIAANEKKAHENWLAARAAERELKEARHEAGVLRQKLTDIERRQFMGPGGLIRPLPTRGIPPAGVMNGPPPPGMDRSPSRGSLPLLPPSQMRDDDFMVTSRGDRGPPPFPLDHRRAPGPPPGMRPLPLDARSPPPRLPPFGGPFSPPQRMPPPGMMDGRSPPPYDRRPPPHHMLERRSPPFRHPPPDMLPPPLRGGPHPPSHLGRGGSGSPTMGPDSPRLDGRYPLPPYGRNPPPPSDRPSPKQSNQTPSRQQQSQV